MMNHTQHIYADINMRTNFDDFVDTCFCINVDVADSLAVTHHRDALCCPLDVPHQLG